LYVPWVRRLLDDRAARRLAGFKRRAVRAANVADALLFLCRFGRK
jgi:hypothetical protein